MKRTSKILAIIMAMTMLLTMVPAYANVVSDAGEESGEILGSEDFQEKTPSEFTPDGTDIEVIYQQDGDNIYWYAGHDTTASTGGWQYANYSLSDLLGNKSFTSGEYTVSFRFKCDNTSGWGHTAGVALFAKSGGQNANFDIENIRTKEGGSSTERTTFKFNDTELTSVQCRTGDDYFIQSGAWYTLKATYNLDQKKVTFNLYNANGEPMIETVSADLPSSELSFTNIRARLDSRFLPQIGLDDIIVSKAEPSDDENEDANSWTENFQKKTPSEFTPDGTDIEVIYQQDEDNIYWYAGHDSLLETGGWQYADYSLADLLGNKSFTSGEYTASFRFKCDNTTGWGQRAGVALFAKSGGQNANFNIENIRTTEGSSSTERTTFKFNDTELTSVQCRTGNDYFIQSGAWYTLKATYNLDQKKATFNLYNANGEPVIETVSADLPSSELTFTSIRASLDSRYLPQIGLDDISVSKAEEKEKVLISCKIGDHGTITVNGEPKETGDTIEIAKGDSITVVAQPEADYQVASVTLGTIAGTLKDGSYVFENISESAALTVDFEKRTEEDQNFWAENFQKKTPSKFTPDGTDIEVIYQQDGDNIYWYAGHDSFLETGGGWQYANYSLADLLGNKSFTSGEYTVSFRFKCDNTTGWSQKTDVSILAKSGGQNANFSIKDIATLVGGSSTEATVLSFNSDNLATVPCRTGNEYFIQSGAWYTLQATYNLDLQKATFNLYNANGEPVIDTLQAQLPHPEITFTDIQIRLDSRFVPQVGLDDISVSKTQQVPVIVNCNQGGKVVYGDQTVTFRDGGKSIDVDYNSDETATFQIVPDEGNEIESVLVNGEELSPAPAEVSFTKLLEAQTLQVVFKGNGPTSEVMDFYVAPNGNDNNPGDIDHPLATLAGIRDRLRSIAKTCPVKVYFREGVYPIGSTVTFNELDSGTEEFPITYAAYPGETVKFSGSVQLDASKAKKVTDPAILNRLVEEKTKDKLMYLDLGEQGIGTLPTPPDEYGRAYWFPFKEAAVYYDGMELTAARWPNSQFLNVNTVDAPDDYKNQPFSLTYHDDSQRTKLWSKEALAANDVYIGMRNSFSFSGIRLASLSPENNGLTSKGGTDYKAEERCMFYFFNILDEIDIPGECYLDRENKILYYYPPNENKTPTIEIASLESALVVLKNTSYLNFEGLIFDGGKDQLITADTVHHINFNGCEISRCSNTAMHLKNITDSAIENCHIFDAGNGGIRVEGSGDRINLTSGNLVIQNNKIHNTDRFVVTYAPAVYLENCVGTLVEHNELYDAVQMLVNLVGCNNIQINYNNIYDAATLFDDTGAIYYGRDMSTMGIEIKYNYFHDIGNKLHSQYGSSSIFCDDFVPGPKIYGNIFYHGSISSDNGGQPRYDSVVRTYFGQFLQMQNNIVIDAPSGFAYGTYNSGKMFRWLMTMYSVKPYDMGWNLWDKMTDFIENPAWLEHYGSGQWSYFAKLKPEYKEQLEALSEKYDYQLLQTSAYETELTAFAESCGFFDKNSKTFSKNLLIKVDQPIWTGDWAKDTVLVEQNYNMTYQAAQDAFAEFGTDFTLTEDALAQIRQSIPDFEKINFKSIGNQPYILNGVTQMPGGTRPNVSQLSVEGEKVENGLVKAAYQWNDADSDIEGYSKITWYLSDSENGAYTEMQNGPVKEFTIPQQTAGQYLKYTVTPIDCRGVRGTTVSSSPVLIINPSDASLKDLQVNGTTIRNFDPNKTEYALFLNEVPTIEAIPVNNDAICQIELGHTLPTEAVITITAPDGVTQKIYRIKIQKLEQTSPTPSSLPTSGPGSSQLPSNQQTSGGITSIGGNNASQQTERKFTDIIGHWAESDINEMAKRGVVSGVTDTTFEPDRAITRAEFAALISRSLRLTATNQQSVFEDVPSNAWYANEVAAAAAAGLITGYERYFRPEDLITREEMAVIVVKAYVFSGKTPVSGTLDAFVDQMEISDWAAPYAEQAVGIGLIKGITANTFAPHDNATRAQATSILKRLLDF